ncbi:TlpA family protein disulfide reductase [Methylobacterium sp. BTF04]|uniref:thiol:disulfide interchange protein TlpA n=1 Tax=Methylobacterium sp. BTF04 TaxID=2708300 RepID=UPI0013CF9BE9|nr:TlpA disulfide reductase family protein [Methylobacterium sp. BTF04]NEU14223.1 TlpA family protein disulfide reductase [Methylobacterium sp. BTF04]
MPGARMALAGGAVLVAVLGAGLAVYGTGPTGGNTARGPLPCAEAAAGVARVAPRARGEVAALQVVETPRPAPVLTFKGPDGADTTLADLRGRVLLVNLWATWCTPCKAEMPALDRLQAEMGGPDFTVVAINVDTRNLDKPPHWLKENGIGRLAYYSDPGGRVLPAIQKDTGSLGLPTTMLVDSRGCTLGVMKGPADWGSADGKNLIAAALGRG